MKVIAKFRGDGKTTDAIKMSGTTGAPIVCATRQDCYHVADMARKYDIRIPFPITIDEAQPRNLQGSYYKELIIDDADRILQRMFNLPILAITISGEEIKYSSPKAKGSPATVRTKVPHNTRMKQ